MSGFTHIRTLVFASASLLFLACYNLATSHPQESGGGSTFVKGGRYKDRDGAVHPVRDLYVDRTEVTADEYYRCVRARRCSHDVGSGSSYIGRGRFPRENCNYGVRGRGLHPMNCLGLAHAMQFCEWQGGRLPTASEWEWIARQSAERTDFPWGPQRPSCEYAIISLSCSERKCFGCNRGGTWPVGSRPRGASRNGILDLVGNVKEFVLSDDRAKFSSYGGSYMEDYPIDAELVTYDFYPLFPEFPYSGGSTEIGFRCVRDTSS